VRGLTIAPGAQFQVHTADPDKARLVITWHGILGKNGNDDGTPPGFFEKMPESERTINVNIFGDQVLSDVVFDWVGKGDIRLLNPDVRDQWQRVSFGKHNTAEPDELFAHYKPNDKMAGQIGRWREADTVSKWARLPPPWQPQENEPFTVQYEGPGIEKQPIPADALSH